MPSRTSGASAAGKELAQEARQTISGPRSKRIALNNRLRSLGGEKRPADAQAGRTFPPKSEYEKFYETVFLAEDAPADEEVTTERRKAEPRLKRPLHNLLGNEESPPAAPRVAKAAETSEPVVRTHITKNYKKEKFNDVYTKTDRHVWKKDAERMLLQVWAQHIKEFRGEAKNILIYRQMAKEMSQFGPSHTEVKTKMDNMSRKYRIEAERVRESGVPSKWEYFHRLQALLIGTKAVNVFDDIVPDDPEQALFSHGESENDEMASMNNESMAGDDPVETEIETRKRTRSPSPIVPDMPDEEEDEPMEDSSPSPISKYRSKTNISFSHSERILQIEEEKLLIEREKLQVMKEALLELNSFHKDIVHFLSLKNPSD
ncbi:uncharacterized protein LOC108035586 [Drosophila biarmipes]|uniref:uncharacterized protein LOC108035586 n=1 Tax=Drosophila biarmipes TaxID=125945 RepID=UPI0007E5FCA9|nr:uncharacterized protein LOC108035586 [Drosophila biarmipes]